MKETPRVRAFFDFIISELVAVRQILGAGRDHESEWPPRKEQSAKHKTGPDVRGKT
jgi:hypothetical protein